jgi:hypothetical protein
MTDSNELGIKYQYEIEYDDGSGKNHFYYADSIDTDHPAFVMFKPLYEVDKEGEGEIENLTVMVPYSRVVEILRRRRPD